MSRLLSGNLTKFVFFVTAGIVTGPVPRMRSPAECTWNLHQKMLEYYPICGIRKNSKINIHRLNMMTRVWGIIDISDLLTNCLFLQSPHSKPISVWLSKNVSMHSPKSVGLSFCGNPSITDEICSYLRLSLSQIWHVYLCRIWPWKTSKIILCLFSLLFRNSFFDSPMFWMIPNWKSHQKLYMLSMGGKLEEMLLISTHSDHRPLEFRMQIIYEKRKKFVCILLSIVAEIFTVSTEFFVKIGKRDMFMAALPQLLKNVMQFFWYSFKTVTAICDPIKWSNFYIYWMKINQSNLSYRSSRRLRISTTFDKHWMTLAM